MVFFQLPLFDFVILPILEYTIYIDIIGLYESQI